MPKGLRQMEVLIELITLEGSSFGSDFREASVAIILNLFWVVFSWNAPPEYCPIYAKASPVIQLN